MPGAPGGASRQALQHLQLFTLHTPLPFMYRTCPCCHPCWHAPPSGCLPQVRTEEECAAAMQAAQGMQDKAVVIECVLDKDDCSVELLQLGKTLQNSNKKA